MRRPAITPKSARKDPPPADVKLPRGFSAAGVHAGLKPSGALDMGFPSPIATPFGPAW